MFAWLSAANDCFMHKGFVAHFFIFVWLLLIEASPNVSEASGLGDPFCKTMRFAKVFTKLRVLSLVQYAKILLMDIDLLVTESIDELFELEAPMAMVRGPKVGYTNGQRVNGAYFFSGTRPDGSE